MLARRAIFDPLLPDRIYEAALSPDKWLGVLQEVADLVGAKGTAVGSKNDRIPMVASPKLLPILNDYVVGGFTGNEARVDPLYAALYPGFVAEPHLRTSEQLYALPIYRDFLLRRECFGACATIIQGVGDVVMHIAIEGFPSLEQAARSVDVLDALRPHLARALSLTSKIAAMRSQAIVDGLGAAGIGAAIVGKDRRLRSMNNGFARRFEDRFHEGRAGFRFTDEHLNRSFLEALSDLDLQGRGRSIVAPSSFGVPPCVVHLLPVVGASRSVVNSDGVIMIIADAATQRLPGADLLRLLFDLTPTEAKLTRLLLDGRTLAEAAHRLGIKQATARVHLRAVFLKTGVTRQVELVALLTGLGPPDFGDQEGSGRQCGGD